MKRILSLCKYNSNHFKCSLQTTTSVQVIFNCSNLRALICPLRLTCLVLALRMFQTGSICKTIQTLLLCLQKTATMLATTGSYLFNHLTTSLMLILSLLSQSACSLFKNLQRVHPISIKNWFLKMWLSVLIKMLLYGLSSCQSKQIQTTWKLLWLSLLTPNFSLMTTLVLQSNKSLWIRNQKQSKL
jgi:hypothetical protein